MLKGVKQTTLSSVCADKTCHSASSPFTVEFDTTPAQILSDPGTYSLTVHICTDEQIGTEYPLSR